MIIDASNLTLITEKEAIHGWRETSIKHARAMERIAELEQENKELKEQLEEYNQSGMDKNLL